MPTPYPQEFRDDVVAAALSGEQSIAKTAKDFGISESCLGRWIKLADPDTARRTASEKSENAEIRELKRRNKVLEQEIEILRRAAAYFAKDISPK